MPNFASKTLYTSEGKVMTGAAIPEKLSNDELKEIRDKGGVAPKLSEIAKVADDRGDTFKAAIEAVKEAEIALENAKGGDARKDADAKLTEARAILFALK